MFMPQGVPARALSISVQTGCPVEQTILATRHGLPVTLHVAPSSHAVHLPDEQTILSPHAVPSACSAPVSLHDWAPPFAQLRTPT